MLIETLINLYYFLLEQYKPQNVYLIKRNSGALLLKDQFEKIVINNYVFEEVKVLIYLCGNFPFWGGMIQWSDSHTYRTYICVAVAMGSTDRRVNWIELANIGDSNHVIQFGRPAQIATKHYVHDTHSEFCCLHTHRLAELRRKRFKETTTTFLYCNIILSTNYIEF